MKKIIREYSQSDLESDIVKAGSSIKGNEMTNGGNLNPDFINILGYIFKSGVTKGCKVMVTAGNDEWHKKNAPNSLHTKGNAIDVTVSDKSCRQSLKKYIDGLRKQYPVSYLDEYEHPSAKATGGHLHIQYGGTPLKTGDESTGVYTGLTSSQTSAGQNNSGNIFKDVFKSVVQSSGVLPTFTEGVESVMSESFQNPVTSSRVSSGLFGDRKTYKYNLISDEDVVAPYDGKIVKIDNNNGKYTVVIGHTYNNKKIKSFITGLDSVSVHQNETVTAGHTIGKVKKNSVLSWSVYDNTSKQQDIKSLLTTDNKKLPKGKGNDKDDYGKNDSFFKSFVKLTNPVALTISGVKALANQGKDDEEETTENLQEEIKRIKQLLK